MILKQITLVTFIFDISTGHHQMICFRQIRVCHIEEEEEEEEAEEEEAVLVQLHPSC